jgi:hypothetical protein
MLRVCCPHHPHVDYRDQLPLLGRLLEANDSRLAQSGRLSEAENSRIALRGCAAGWDFDYGRILMKPVQMLALLGIPIASS